MPKIILTDIEGTTSSIAFVKDVLFPYARARLPDFVVRRGAETTIARLLEDVRQMAADVTLCDADVSALLVKWMDEDRKATPLKSLQGLIWADGYHSGALKGHVYDDAIAGLRRWHERGLDLYVYSSGSVAAQKLLFGHTKAGDLTPLFSGYFDTATGSKLDPQSYQRIAAEIGAPPDDILFLSDNVAELDAAKAAGMKTICLDRGEAEIPPGHGHDVMHSFEGLEP